MADPALYGVVLSGGQSSRMGRDKGLLNYHGEKQVVHVLNILNPFCDKTFVSCNPDQAQNPDYSVLPLIIDQYSHCGALAGILSAFKQASTVAWLVLACDMPNINTSLIRQLISNRNVLADATAFLPGTQAFPEPLCAIYEPKAVTRLKRAYEDRQYALVALLQSLNPHLISVSDPTFFENINTLPDHQKATQKNGS